MNSSVLAGSRNDLGRLLQDITPRSNRVPRCTIHGRPRSRFMRTSSPLYVYTRERAWIRTKERQWGKSGPGVASSMRVTLHRNGIPLENVGKQIIVANETPYALRRCLWSRGGPSLPRYNVRCNNFDRGSQPSNSRGMINRNWSRLNIFGGA